jgi:hypothetical protein
MQTFTHLLLSTPICRVRERDASAHLDFWDGVWNEGGATAYFPNLEHVKKTIWGLGEGESDDLFDVHGALCTHLTIWPTLPNKGDSA